LLESLIDPPVKEKDGKKITPIVKDYDDMSKDTTVDFIITFAKGKLDELEATKADNGCNGVEKLLKLFTTNTTTNMHLFNAEDKLKKYEKVTEIIDEYYDTRLKLYQERKKYLISALESDIVSLRNKCKYIKELLEDTIDLRKKKKDEVIKLLQDKGYNTIDGDSDYTYLIKMPMDSVTEENIARLFKELNNKETELEMIKGTTENQMWLSELENFKMKYIEYKEERQMQMMCQEKQKKKVIVKKSVKKTNIVIEEN